MFRMVILLLPLFAMAEQEYFTWVDAQGRIHNSLVSREPEEKSDAGKQNDGVSEQVQDIKNKVPSLSADKNEYLTEEQFAQKLEQDKVDNPPFFTYVDEAGQVRNQVIIDSQIEVEELDAPVSYDHIYAPPFRVSDKMAKQCCNRYRSYFKERIPAEKSVLLSGFLNTIPISTRFGPKQAWYFKLTNPSDFRILQLKLRQNDQISTSPIAMILADRQFDALYFAPELSMISNDGSWFGQPSRNALLKIDDPEVMSVIVYFPENAPVGASLEVNWWHGKASD